MLATPFCPFAPLRKSRDFQSRFLLHRLQAIKLHCLHSKMDSLSRCPHSSQWCRPLMNFHLSWPQLWFSRKFAMAAFRAVARDWGIEN